MSKQIRFILFFAGRVLFMNILIPDYYNGFKCVADRCLHNCCIGWEIDIDEDTLCLYGDIGGEFGKRLKDNISDDEYPHFILREHGRCPFLNEKGLCDIIAELGDGALCDICADHPRYRNYFDDRLEMGLGLSCEEAARIILSNENKVKLVDIDTGVPVAVFPERQRLLDILQDRSLPLKDRLKELCTLPDKDYFAFFSSLERLSGEWDGYLELLKSKTADISEFDTVFEQLAVYFLLRHSAESLLIGSFVSALSVYIIQKISAALKYKNGTLTLDEIIEISRMYSSEIEYSDENTEKMINITKSSSF